MHTVCKHARRRNGGEGVSVGKECPAAILVMGSVV